jgi:branched-chain amino acid transport system substrate-binding protein
MFAKGFVRWGIVAVLVVTLLASLAGCGQQQPAPAPEEEEGEEEPVATESIKIGIIAPMTGETPTFGASTRDGALLAVEEYNAKGGVLGRQIEWVLEDDKGDAVEAANAGRKLVNQDKVVAIIGSVYSVCSLAIAPIAQEAKIPMISPTSTNERVTLTGDYIFRACFIDPFQGFVMAKFSTDNLQAKTAAVLYDIENDYTKGLAEEFKKHFENMGGTVVAFETHASGDQDFRAQLTKIKAAEPDVLFLPQYYQTASLQAKQVREMGWDVQMLGADGWDSPDLISIAGDAVEGGYHANHYSPDSDTPIAQAFLKAYNDKYGKTPDALAALAYDAALILFEAIEKAGSTEGSAIRDAMAATDLEVVSGKTTYDANRNPIKAAVVNKIENGEFKFYTVVNP